MKPGDIFPVHMAWTLPDGRRLRATFQAEVLALEPQVDRLSCRLTALVACNGPEDDEWTERVRSQVGKRVLLPGEANGSLVLPLKAGTLTGAVRYFYS